VNSNLKRSKKPEADSPKENLTHFQILRNWTH